MAPSHKAETVNQILTNHKKLFSISRDHFHCSPNATGEQLAKEVAFLSTRQEGQNRQEMKECALFVAYHGEAELVAEELNFLKKSKRFEFSYELLLKAMVA